MGATWQFVAENSYNLLFPENNNKKGCKEMKTFVPEVMTNPVSNNRYDFPVEVLPIEAVRDEGLRVATDDFCAIIRTDTKKVLGVVKPTYKLVPYADVIDGIENTLFSKGMKFTRSVSLGNGGMYMNARYTFPEIKADVRGVGDPVTFGFTLSNSYGGYASVAMQLFVTRLVCTNGMVSKERTFQLTSRHTSSFSIDKFVAQSESAYKYYTDGVIPYYKKLATLQITKKEVAKSLFDGIILQPKEKKYQEKLPAKYGEEIRRKYEEDNIFSLWGVMNACTFVITHGIMKEKPERGLLLLGLVDRYMHKVFTYLSARGY
jgi:hypothetical protein